jgi:UPF0755 protein
MGNHFYDTDRYILSYLGYPQHGWLKMPSGEMSRYEILHHITTAKATGENIMLIPGETTKMFLYEVAQQYRYNYKDLYSYYLSKSPLEEGFLVPETYQVPLNVSYKYLVDLLVSFAKSEHRKDMIKLKIRNFKEWKRTLIVASIIEKESGTEEEMPLVASVIYNRLEKGMKLQMDGTLNYGFNSHKRVTPEMIRTDTTRYNTYRYKGLPPAPVCNPSHSAIEAALFPEETKYLYFMRIKGTNQHQFTDSYREHLRNIKSNM